MKKLLAIVILFTFLAPDAFAVLYTPADEWYIDGPGGHYGVVSIHSEWSVVLLGPFSFTTHYGFETTRLLYFEILPILVVALATAVLLFFWKKRHPRPPASSLKEHLCQNWDYGVLGLAALVGSRAWVYLPDEPRVCLTPGELLVITNSVAVVSIALLVGLYQQQVHQRTWGVKLLVWVVAFVLLAGMVVHLKDRFLPAWLGGGFALAYWVGWWWQGGKQTGWRRHLVRAAAFAICLGLLAAVPWFALPDLASWFGMLCGLPAAESAWMVICGLPGLYLVGAVAFMVSVGLDTLVKRETRAPGLRWVTLAVAGSLIPVLNWYAAVFYGGYAASTSKDALLRLAILSRPGLVRLRETHAGPFLLYLAAYSGNAVTVRLLLGAGADANAGARSGRTALHVAARSNRNQDVIRALLDGGADIHGKDGSGRTALHEAVTSRNAESPKALLAAGADVRDRDGYGATALHLAAGRGRTDAVKLLLAGGADIDAKSCCGATALHEAAAGGHVDTAKELLVAGADMSAKDDAGRTPLCRAASCGMTDAVKALLAAGADINAKANAGSTPLDAAQDGLRMTVATYRDFRKRLTATIALLKAAGAKTGKELEAAQQAAAVNAKTAEGRAVLFSAARDGYVDIVRALLAAGAGPNANDEDGKTALHVAAQYGRPETVKALLEAGGEVNAETKDGRTPLDLTQLALGKAELFPPPPEISRHGLNATIAVLKAAGAKTGKELDAEKTPEPK